MPAGQATRTHTTNRQRCVLRRAGSAMPIPVAFCSSEHIPLSRVLMHPSAAGPGVRSSQPPTPPAGCQFRLCHLVNPGRSCGWDSPPPGITNATDVNPISAYTYYYQHFKTGHPSGFTSVEGDGMRRACPSGGSNIVAILGAGNSVDTAKLPSHACSPRERLGDNCDPGSHGEGTIPSSLRFFRFGSSFSLFSLSLGCAPPPPPSPPTINSFAGA